MTLAEQIKQFPWYHEIEVEPGLKTVPRDAFRTSWDLIESGLSRYDWKGKTVLDIGTRDGAWAFKVEKAGAAKVVAIDNDQSPGALWLKERNKSLVEFKHMNLYELKDRDVYDVVMFMGVVYHLRFPMLGLYLASQAVKRNGLLLIEAGIMTVKDTENTPLLYCPVEDSPYEASSCSFFNLAGLNTTLRSMGVQISDVQYHPAEPPFCRNVVRAFVHCVKTDTARKDVCDYWFGLHTMHDQMPGK